MSENLHGRAVLPGFRRMLLALAGLFFLLSGSAQSQSTVSGVVTDASGEGIAGVAVIVKGTTTGTSTDMKGAYTIRASKSDVLVFSFLGYKTQEVAVHNRMEIDVSGAACRWMSLTPRSSSSASGESEFSAAENIGVCAKN